MGSISGNRLCFNVTVIDDQVNESNETFTLNIGSPVNGQIGNVSSTVVTILDNEIGLNIFLQTN